MFFWSLTSVLHGGIAAPVFEVEKQADRFQVRRDGKPFLNDLHILIGPHRFGSAPEFSETVLPDGRKAWNAWSRRDNTRFRLEIVLSKDKTELEINFSSEAPAYPEHTVRVVRMTMPWELCDGCDFRMLLDNGRSWNETKGKFSRQQLNWHKNSRFTALDIAGAPVLLDANPRGAGDENSMYRSGVVRGVMTVETLNDGVSFHAGSTFDSNGGMIAFKLVIRPGVFEDFDRCHALRSFRYRQPLPVNRSYSFGAAQTGKTYTHADTLGYDRKRGAGWLESDGLEVKKSDFQGAYFSAVSGKDRTFAVGGLPDGLYLVTAGIGNWGNWENNFVIACNQDAVLSPEIRVGGREAVNVVLPVWVRDHKLEIAFRGRFLVSTLHLQRLTAEAEDFTFRRGFWGTDGYEPSSIYRNADTPPGVKYSVSVDRFPMPEPGKETAGTLRDVSAGAAAGDWDRRELDWRAALRLKHLGGNSCSLSEYEDPAVFQRFIDDAKVQQVNGLLLSGLHSRHTFPEQRARSMRVIGCLAAQAHKNHMRLIDHHDSTLLWNDGSGFRVLVERLGETVRSLNGMAMTPNPQFCIANPDFLKTYTAYLEELMKTGIDGLMIDELTFYPFGCGCSHCRKAFYEDTNWQLPLNELDDRLFDPKSPLWRVWLDWRKKKCSQIRVRLRQRLEKIRRDFSMLCYTTHYGFISGYPAVSLGADLMHCGDSVDFFGAEVMPRNLLANQRQLPALRNLYNLLRIAYKTPIFVWLYSSHWDDFYFGWAVCNMHNQEAALLPLTRPEGGGDFAAFVPPRNMSRLEAEPVAEVALLFSSASRDWNQLMSVQAEMLGIAQTLEELHIPYEFIGEMSLKPEVLARYKVLLTGANGCWSDEELAVVKDFARKGGIVQLGATSGRFDVRGNWREKDGFADVFQWELRRSSDVASALWANGKVLMENFNQRFIRPRTGKVPEELRCGDETVQIGRQMWPLIYKKDYGKGCFYLLPMNFFAQLYAVELDHRSICKFERDERLAALAHDLLKRMIGGAAYWQTDAPEKVLTAIYKQRGRYAVHLLNGTGGGWPTGKVVDQSMVPEPFPVLSKPVTFTLPVEKAPVRIYAVSPDFAGERPLTWQYDAGKKCVSVTVPTESFKAYTLVWIE